LVHGHFNPKNPKYFVVIDGGGFKFGDAVVLEVMGYKRWWLNA
jgi:hypothetical protein